jgi:hypothetical protein
MFTRNVEFPFETCTGGVIIGAYAAVGHYQPA